MRFAEARPLFYVACSCLLLVLTVWFLPVAEVKDSPLPENVVVIYEDGSGTRINPETKELETFCLPKKECNS